MIRKLLLGVAASAAMAGAAHAVVIPNADFSNGAMTGGAFAGFTSSYTEVADTSGALVNASTLTIGSDPSFVNSNWVASSAGNNALLVNGSTAGGTFVYTSNAADAIAAGAYTFTAQVANVCCNASFPGPNAASSLNFSFSLNGGAFTPFVSTTNPYSAPAATANALSYQSVSYSFVNPTSGTFQVRITDGNGAASGNDFAIDNLAVNAVSAAPEPGSWALMLAGVGFTGLLLRSRRRQSVSVQTAAA